MSGMKFDFLIEYSFLGGSGWEDRSYEVRCWTPQEAVDSLCSCLLKSGYYFPMNYRINCVYVALLHWAVSERFVRLHDSLR